MTEKFYNGYWPGQRSVIVFIYCLDISTFRTQSELEENILTGENRLRQLESDLRDVEADINDASSERTDLKQELTSMRSHIQGLIQ